MCPSLHESFNEERTLCLQSLPHEPGLRGCPHDTADYEDYEIAQASLGTLDIRAYFRAVVPSLIWY